MRKLKHWQAKWLVQGHSTKGKPEIRTQSVWLKPSLNQITLLQRSLKDWTIAVLFKETDDFLKVMMDGRMDWWERGKDRLYSEGNSSFSAVSN